MADSVQYYGTGRRKSSVARVRLVPGTGKITINKRDIDDYFGLETLKVVVRQPLDATKTLGKFDVLINVNGGGLKERNTVSRQLVARLSSARDNLLFKPYQNGSKSPENQGFPGFYYI